jgi:hypothetical protein
MAKAKENQGSVNQGNEQQRTNEGERQPSQAVQTTGESGGQRQAGITRREQYAPSPWAGAAPSPSCAASAKRWIGSSRTSADLPGLTKDDINVDITDDALVIRGERKSEREENEEGYYRSERSYGSFYRQIPLPEGVNVDDADATFRDGVLEITMTAPERAAEQCRRLEIREGSEGEAQSRGQGAAAGQK